MNVKVIFNMDTTLKKAAMTKAKKNGLTLSTVLNMVTRAYVDNKVVISALEYNIAKGLDDIAHGRVTGLEQLKQNIQRRRSI